jgi:hypothetical protein
MEDRVNSVKEKLDHSNESKMKWCLFTPLE